MNTLQKSLLALESLLETLSKEDMDKIVADIEGMSGTGPTVFKYLEEFDKQFQVLDCEHDCWVIDNIPSLNTISYSEPISMQQNIVEIKHIKRHNFDISSKPININSLTDFPIAA